MKKKKRGGKSEVVKFRVTKKTKARLKELARAYAGGNVSLWAEYALLEAPRRMLAK